MGDFITVSKQGVSVPDAKGIDVLFSTQAPFAKLDSLNPVSFQEIELFFNAEPPDPDSSNGYRTQTLVYSFKHNYKYVPSYWMMATNVAFTNPPIPTSQVVGAVPAIYYPYMDETPAVIYGFGSPIAQVFYWDGIEYSTATISYLSLFIDKTNVNVYVNKVAPLLIAGSPVPITLAGTTLELRFYIFVEDLLGGSVPTHP